MITFIITTRNNPEYLETCLTQLGLQRNTNWSAIVIDTSDEIIIKKNHTLCSYYGEKIRYIKPTTEYGFATKNNIGIKMALANDDCKFVCLLNDDAYIGEDFIDNILKYSNEYPEVYAFSPLYMYEYIEDTIQVMGGGFFTNNALCGEAQLYNNTKIDNVPIEILSKPQYLDFGYGAALVYRREVFEIVGYLDDVFKHGFDEPDLAKRMALKGLKIMYVPTTVYHVCGGSSKKKSTFKNLSLILAMNRARLYFLLKHYPLNVVINEEIKKLISIILKPKSFLLELYSIGWNIIGIQSSRAQYNKLYKYEAII